MTSEFKGMHIFIPRLQLQVVWLPEVPSLAPIGAAVFMSKQYDKSIVDNASVGLTVWLAHLWLPWEQSMEETLQCISITVWPYARLYIYMYTYNIYSHTYCGIQKFNRMHKIISNYYYLYVLQIIRGFDYWLSRHINGMHEPNTVTYAFLEWKESTF